MKKIIYGRNSIGSYAKLYTKFWIFWIVDTIGGSSSAFGGERMANEWKEQYRIPDELFIRKDN